MPRDARALTRAARKRSAEKKIPYQDARDDAIQIHGLMESEGLSWSDAEYFYDTPGPLSTGADEPDWDDPDPDRLIWCRECGAGAAPYDECECPNPRR
ncbi:hypothetical protein [Amycolatopsis rubida]|uniref:Uncharacterized protein n=1 Tax=Amycolatopsis rubida TaxID=112413 RepID=A0A1I5X8D7_9PSEU|nr:hypothetical protein [Amycolatopsis rubida]SFQ28076.1 hypothetical protein SAMN05421854_11087 [Amycolatopsis rubida]